MRGETGYGKVQKKELLEAAVVTVGMGKVEIGRETAVDAGFKWG